MTGLDPDKFSLSNHAVARILEMGLTADEVAACLAHPESVVESRAHRGSWNYRAGRVTLGVNKHGDHLRVVTAIWSTQDDWERDLAIGGTDRTPKSSVRNLKVHA